MNKNVKRFVAVLLAGLAISVPAAGHTASLSPNYFTGAGALSESRVDWENGMIEARGTGRMPQDVQQGAEDLARRAAIMDAYRNLAEAIGGVQVDADSSMEMLLLKNDSVRTQIRAVIRGAGVVEEGLLPNGSYYVKVKVPLYGVNSIAAAALPDAASFAPPPGYGSPSGLPDSHRPPASSLTPEEVSRVLGAGYTGVIIDTGSLGVVPAMSPVVYDTSGRVVYSARSLAPNLAVERGVVGYAPSVDGARAAGSRVGTNALVVRAVSASGGREGTKPVNVVISKEDADRILLSDQNEKYLQKGAIMMGVRA